MNWPWINKDCLSIIYLSIYLSTMKRGRALAIQFHKNRYDVQLTRSGVEFGPFFHRIVGKMYESRSMLYKQGSSIFSRRLTFDGFLTSLPQTQTFAWFSVTREAKLACTGIGSTSVRTLGIYVTDGRRSRAFVNIWAKTRNSQMIHAPQASWAS